MRCNCPGCQGTKPHPTPPTNRSLDAWNARVRASLGKPARDDLPADVRAIVEMV